MAAKPEVAEGAIIVPVELPVAAERLRQRMDPAAAQGVQAHVTLLWPFLAPEALDDAARRRLAQVIDREPAFAFSLSRVGRWPEVVYLAPEPDAPFRRLIAMLHDAFPEFPPYGGAHDEVVPHVTIAHDPRPEYLAAAEHALPAMLLGHVAGRPWQTHLHLPFGSAGAGR